jgi:ketosteroid isomerase-like protein
VEAPAEIERWLDAFAAAVRAADYDRGAGLFDPAALGFGTVATRAEGLESLRREQWQRTWGATRGFRFDMGGTRIETRDGLAWVAATWSSTGFDARGLPFPRLGRATLVLRRGAVGWLAVHTHFSLRPDAAGEP